MEEHRQLIIIICVGIYMVLTIGIGIWALRRTKSASDFFVAGRSLGPLVVGMAVFSSTLSGFGFVGGPGLVYATGLSSLWMAVPSTMGYALAFFLVAKRIRMISEVRDTISLPDVLAARFGSETVRVLTGITILLGVLGYLATQILAMSIVLRSILNGMEAFADIGLVTCALISVSVLMFYAFTGGIVASVYTDLVQGLVMIAAAALVFVAASAVFDGGLQEASEVIFQDDPETIMPFGALGVSISVAWFFMIGLGFAGQPHIVTKFMMNRKISDNRLILPLTIFGYAVSVLLWVSIGVVMHAVVIDGQLPPLESADAAVSVFLSMFANPLLAGVVFAGLFAAIMSTADAFLNIGAAAIMHDIPKPFLKRPLRNELAWARGATVVLSVVATGIALYSFYYGGQLVAVLGAFGWGMFAAALVPLVVIGLNWKGATRIGAIAAISVSIVINLGVQLFSIALPYGMAGGFVALLASLIVFISVSLVTRADPIPDDLEKIMDI